MIRQLMWVLTPWKKIETAPKYKKILLFSDWDGIRVGFYDDIYSNWILANSDDGVERINLWTYDGQETENILYPTHWKPLPPKPREKRNEKV